MLANLSTQYHRHMLKWSAIPVICIIALLFPVAMRAQAASPTYDITRQCFAVADERLTSTGKDSQDTLVRLDRTDAQTFVIGLTGTQDIEAMAFGPNATLYVADGGQLGTLDLTTGAFTPKSAPFGPAKGSVGTVKLNNADGLFYDIHTNRLYGIQHRLQAQKDVLFVINPTTGAIVANAFGANADYIELASVVDDAGNPADDVDDVAVDPINGTMFATMQTASARVSVLAIIDPVTGAATKVATMHYPNPYPENPALAGHIVHDIEGLSFFNDGQLYGSTGNNGPDAPDKNKLVRIDKTTGLAAIVGAFPAGLQDYEAVACLTADAHISLKKFTNGPGQLPQDADSPTGPQIPVGAPVTWTYMITNTGMLTLTNLVLTDDKEGVVGPGGLSNCPPPNTILGPGASIQCTATGVAQAGQYANTAVVTGSTPAGLVDPQQTVNATDLSHYFGVTPGLVIEKLTNGNPATQPNDPDVPVIAPGATVTWIYRIANTGSVPFAENEIKVTDNMIGAITQIVDKGNGDALLAPGETWVFQAIGPALNLSQSQNNVTIIPGCDPAHTGQTRPTYENIGTVTANNITASIASHYCNPLAAVGDRVFRDINPNGATPAEINSGNGLQDAGESGVDGVQVQLHAANGALVATMVTANNGLYRFDNVVPGDYYLVFINPTAVGVWTTANQGNDDALDSDTDTSLNADVAGNAARTVGFTLEPGQVDLRWDAGLVAATDAAIGNLGDYVWHDLNGNGLQDEGPTQGLANVPVQLFTSNGQAVASTTTNQNGFYLFFDVAPGQYYIEFSLPQGFSGFSPASQGSDRGKDSDVATITSSVGRTPIFTFAGNGITDLSWDAGVYQNASVGDFIWLDTNNDGIQQATEQANNGIDQVTVELYSASGIDQGVNEVHGTGVLVQQTNTDAKGNYAFTNLAPGKYYLRFALPQQRNGIQTKTVPPHQGTERNLDSDAAPSTGETAIFTLQSGQYDDTWDAGIEAPTAEGEAPEPTQNHQIFLPLVHH